MDATGFATQFRATFGAAPAPAGPTAVACIDAPVLPSDGLARLTSALGLRAGVTVPDAARPGTLWTGVPLSRTLALGPDPAGLATALGADPAAFGARADAKLVVTGGGLNLTLPVAADGTVAFSATPTAPGPVSYTLNVPGAAVQTSLAPSPADLAAPLAPQADSLGPLYRQMLAAPDGWTLAIPLSGTPGATTPVATAAVAPPESAVTTLGIRPATADEAARAGVPSPGPGRVPYLVQASAADGTPVRRARLTVTASWTVASAPVTDGDGRALVWVAPFGGAVEVRAVASRAASRLALAGAPPRSARLALARLRDARVRALRANPRVARAFTVRVNGPDGTAGAFTALRVKTGPGAGRRVVTDSSGVATVLVRAARLRGTTLRIEGVPRVWRPPVERVPARPGR